MTTNPLTDATVRDILQSRPCREGLSELCDELDEAPARVERLAERSLHEMISRHDWLATNAYRFIGNVLSRRFRIDVDHQALRALRELDQEHAIAWLPSHRSYLDMFYLEQVVQQADIQPSFVLGGDNLDFWPIGPILRRAGVLYIRRATRDKPVYRFALRSYLAHLVRAGRNLTWSLEGGRSRTGKLRPPRYGALKYVVDAVRDRDDSDVMMVPVSVVYDQLPEVEAMTEEALGGSKRPEGLGWLLEFARGQESRSTVVHIDFGEPIDMRARLRDLERDPRTQGKEVERLALEVSHRINRATPAVPTAIVTLALLGAERALSLEETREALQPILDYLQRHPTVPHALSVPPRDPSWVLSALQKLTNTGVLKVFTGGNRPVWYIAPERHLVAAFYRNTLIHLVVNRAIAELAMFMAREHDSGALREAIWGHAMTLRQLLKFEFSFSPRRDFEEELIDEISLIDPDWKQRNVSNPVVTNERLERWFTRAHPHLAHLVLRPFFDAYRVVADELARWPAASFVDRKRLLKRCLGFGRQLVLQGRLHSAESVTLELFRNALKLAEHRGLLARTGPEAQNERSAFAEQIAAIVEDLEALSQMQRTVS